MQGRVNIWARQAAKSETLQQKRSHLIQNLLICLKTEVSDRVGTDLAPGLDRGFQMEQ